MPVVHYQGKEYPCRDDENILVALLRQGVELKHSCRAGVCNACVMQATESDGESLNVGGLDAALIEQGCFLPCKTRVRQRIAMREAPQVQPDSYGLVASKRWLSHEVVELTIDPAYNPDYLPGQFVTLIHPDGTRRPYSLASSPTASLSMVFHVRRHDQGKVSRWLADELEAGDTLQLSHPDGHCHLSDSMTRVVMLGFGVGIAPLYGMAQQVADGGSNVEDLLLVHLGRGEQGIYLDEALQRWADEQDALEYHGLNHRDALFGEQGLFATQLDALAKQPDVHWFVCGSPEAVQAAGDRLQAQGADKQRIYFDPFENTVPVSAQASESEGVQESNQTLEERPYPATQPELWQWLEQDNRLGAIINDFYQRIFNDDIMRPYFHNTTQQRSREKVYSFYKRLFSGEPCFFGDRPRNAHHWMVITHDIYDHRLTLLESTLRDHKVPEHLRTVWLEYEEYYRSDIVKDDPRGRQVGDTILPATGFGRETLTCGAICDSCGAIIEEGENVLYHLRTGQLYCGVCEGKAIV